MLKTISLILILHATYSYPMVAQNEELQKEIAFLKKQHEKNLKTINKLKIRLIEAQNDSNKIDEQITKMCKEFLGTNDIGDDSGIDNTKSKPAPKDLNPVCSAMSYEELQKENNSLKKHEVDLKEIENLKMELNQKDACIKRKETQDDDRVIFLQGMYPVFSPFNKEPK